MVRGRLEEIKEEYEWHVRNQLLPRTSDDNFEWLIKQAERAQELEKVIEFMDKQRVKMGESHQETISNIDSVIEQNKRYREALERISEHEVYGIDIKCGEELSTDAGKIARRVLEGDEGCGF